MRIKSVTVHNWRKYADRQFEFDGNVIGIVGPNDGGKSTIVAAIQYLLLGSTTPPRRKVRNIKFGEKSGFVEGTFTHRGRTITINRDIETARCSLKVEDGETLRKGADVEKFMTSFLGVSPGIFNNHVLISQGRLDAPLTMRHADLSKDFQILFGTERCESLRDMLLHRLNACPAPSAEKDVARLETERTEIQEDIAVVNAECSRLTHKIKGLEVTNADELISRYKKHNAQAESRSALVDSLDSNRTHLTRLQIEFDTLSVVIRLMQKTIADSKADVAEAKDVIKKDRLYQERADQVNVLLKDTARAERDVATARALVVPPSPNVDDAGKVHKECVRYEVETATAVSYVEKFEGETGDVECPTCRQTVLNVAALVDRYRKLIEDLKPKWTSARREMVRLTAELDEHNTAARDKEERVLRTTATLESVNKQVAAINLDIESIDPEDLKVSEAMVATFDDLSKRLVLKSADETAKKSAIVRLTTQVKDEQRKFDELKMVAAVTEDEYKDANSKHDEHEELSKDLNQQTGKLDPLKVREKKLSTELQSLETAKAKDKGIRTYRSLLERSRSLLHHDNLPRVVAIKHLQGINAGLSRILSMLGFPYTVELQDTLSFLCKSPDGHDVMADELGGGRRMLFSLAFRLAVNERFASEIGLLVLDEPTVYVDEDNVAAIAEVFDNVRQYVRASGMQIIVVTHEERLRRAFDRVIDVGQL